MVLGTALGASVWAQLHARHDLNALALVFLLLMIAVAGLLVVGYETRVVAVMSSLAILGGAFFASAKPGYALFENLPIAGLLTVIAASVACVGPGAYSLDSRVFGRREIVIPKSSRPPGSI
jgi:uncharacterized membrane protein YphA (DoxX/SURF4 family)